MQSVHDRLKRAKKAWNDECELRGRVLVESNQQCHQNEDSSVDINSSSGENCSVHVYSSSFVYVKYFFVREGGYAREDFVDTIGTCSFFKKKKKKK